MIAGVRSRRSPGWASGRMMKILASGVALLMSTACTSQQQCMAPGAAVPDRAKVMANLTGGQTGRDAMAAVFAGDVEAVRRLIAADGRVLDTKVTVPADFDSRPDGQWGDLLTIAVSRCDEPMVRALLDLDASPNGADAGWALSTAVEQRTPDMAALLLDAGADPDPAATGGHDVIPGVLAYGGKGAMMLLLRHGLDPNREGPNGGQTALWTAIASEQYEIAELLMDHGASGWVVAGSGGTPALTLSRGGPIAFGGPDQDARRQALLDRMKAVPGTPWPPPDVLTMRKLVLAGEFPGPAALAAGVPPVSRMAREYLARFYNPDGSAKPPL